MYVALYLFMTLIHACDDTGAQANAVDLSPAFTAEALQPILTNPDFVDRLKPYLPEMSPSMPPAENLQGVVTSPQFKQVATITNILNPFWGSDT